MARAFICHEPVDFEVAYRNSFYQHTPPVLYHSFTVEAAHISELDLCYLCFVHEGKCYAARTKSFFSSGKMVVVSCVDFSDNPSGKKMILKDYLLGG